MCANKTSIVIPLGHGSRWNNTELRYCLRSVEKHLTGYGDVFIVGEKPDWLRNVIHIPCPDYGDKTYHKERNIFTKILAACADERVTDDFLFMNDDHFLLQDFEAGKFPYYYNGSLGDFMTVTDYKHTVKNTVEITGRGALYYDVHSPINYDKYLFHSLLLNFDWSVKFGYCIKTLYNWKWPFSWKEPVEYPDLKINETYTADNIRELLTGRPWFSIGDRAREGDMLQVLQELYPKKSIYE